MLTFAAVYLLSGTILLTAALWIVGDLAPGRRIALTSRMFAAALLWSAALL